eukprot:COSAG06_NODE_2344_length_7035_cov_13.462659_1_plen_84_part_10
MRLRRRREDTSYDYTAGDGAESCEGDGTAGCVFDQDTGECHTAHATSDPCADDYTAGDGVESCEGDGTAGCVFDQDTGECHTAH